MSGIAEAIAMAALLSFFFLTRRYANAALCAVENALGHLGRRRGLSVVLVGLLALAASAMVSLLGGTPQPRVHDEFSYLLAADTFARGRLANPAHPLWAHFESIHIIQQPTYASKYPPAQGLMLAAGQAIGGHPIVGVWIATALACAALCWMLLGWLPSWLAMVGSLIAVLHPGIVLRWGQSYWGGALAVIGGALVFGAMRRIVHRPRLRDAVLLGLGLAILANSRPYEGLLASLPVAVVLLAWMFGKNGQPLQVSIKRIVLPIGTILAVTFAAMGYYNLRVTGDALRMPYMVHEAAYAVAPFFIWQNPRPPPAYRHEVIKNFHLGWELEPYLNRQSIRGFINESVQKVRMLRIFFQGSYRPRLALTLPLLLLPWLLRDRWPRFALLTSAVFLLGLFMVTWHAEHYSAPIIALVFALALQGMRRLRLLRWSGWPAGRFLVWTICIITAASFAFAFVQKLQNKPSGWEWERARLLDQLKEDGGRHLMIVRYGPLHSPLNEWVYNEANIDGAKIVWAREMDTEQNRKLLEYFKDRAAWLVEVDHEESPPKVLPYSAGGHE
jgi:hypothetical protein